MVELVQGLEGTKYSLFLMTEQSNGHDKVKNDNGL